jgi:hypothetical protein
LALDNLKPFRLPLYRKAKRFCIEPGTAAVLKEGTVDTPSPVLNTIPPHTQKGGGKEQGKF